MVKFNPPPPPTKSERMSRTVRWPSDDGHASLSTGSGYPVTTPSSFARVAVGALVAIGLWLGAAGVAWTQDLAPMELNVGEGDTGTYSIKLNSVPTGMVTITPSVPPASDVSVSGAVTFTITNWNTAQTVTVTAEQDTDTADDTVTISHAVSGYGSVTTAGQVVVTVFDDDAPSFRAATVEPQGYVVHTAIPTLTLPAATGGTEPLAYTLTPAADIPIGLTLDLNTRTLAGTPVALASARSYTWIATDSNGAFDTLIFPITIRMTTVCDRTPEVRDALVAAIDGVTDCADVTPAHLRGITTLALMGSGVPGEGLASLQIGDFAGLSALEELDITGYADLAIIPPGVFAELSALTILVLRSSASTLPVGVFAGLSALTDLFLDGADLVTLPPNVFDGLSAVTEVWLNDNDFTTLPVGVFAGLSAVEFINLRGNDITTLPAGLFGGLDALDAINLIGNQLTALSEGFFDGVSPPGGLGNVNLRENPGIPFTLNLYAEQEGDGQARVRVPEATPLNIEVTWTIGGTTGTATIPAGRRTSDAFGMAMASAADVTLSNPRFPGVTEDTGDDAGFYQGFRLSIVAARSGVVLNPATLTVPEGGTATYTVYLNTDPNGAVTLTPSITPSSNDLTLTPSGALTFTTATWHTARTITVAAATDADITDDPATISYAVSGYGTVTAATLALVIDDTNDQAPDFGTAAIEPLTYTARAPIPVLTLPAAAGGDGDLAYTLSGPLPGGLRYNAATRTVSGIPTATTDMVTLRYTVMDADDNVADHDADTLTFAMTIADAVAGVTLGRAALTVYGGESTTYTVVLATEPTGDVTVTPSVPDGSRVTVSGGLIFTTANWSTEQAVTVAAGARLDFDDTTVTVSHTVSGYGSIANADDVTVTVVASPRRVPTFGAAIVPDQTYFAGSPIPTLTLPAAGGGNGALSYALTGGIPAGLTFAMDTLTLTGTSTVDVEDFTLTYTVSDTDSDNTADDEDVLTFAVVFAHPGITTSSATLTVVEGSTVAYTVVLNTVPAGNVTVAPSVPDGAGVTVSGPLTFVMSAWNVAQTVTVTATEDADRDHETVSLSHAVSGYGSVTDADPVTVTVTDNDVPAVTVSESVLSVVENGNATYTILLAVEPSGDVTVTPSVPDGTIVTLSGALVFTMGDWNTAQTVTVTAGDDDDASDNTVTISHAVAGADYNAVAAADVSVMVLDDERAGFGVTIIEDQIYAMNRAIALLTLPESSGGAIPLTYTFTGTLPAGLAYNDGPRTISGTPTAVFPETRYTWTVTDSMDVTASLTFTMAVYETDVCLRTPEVRDAIVAAITGVTDCADVTPAELRGIHTLSVTDHAALLAIRLEDFAGINPSVINITGNGLTTLPGGLFRNMGSLQALGLNDNQFTTLPVDLLEGMVRSEGARISQLQDLNLADNRLTALPVGIFTGLSTVTNLNLSGNRLTILPRGLFDGMNALLTLRLQDNMLETLEAGAFSGIGGTGSLEVTMIRNRISNLPGDLFTGLGGGRLTSLFLLSNRIVRLPVGLFDGLTALTAITLGQNPGAQFALFVETRQQGDGRLRLRVLEAAPFPITADWTLSGTTTAVTIPAGQRESTSFGSSSTSDDIVVSNPRFTRATRFNPFRLVLGARANEIIASPSTLTVAEGGMATYGVWLNTAPTGTVTVTPSATSTAAHELTFPLGALTFTTANWYLTQNLTVNAGQDIGATDDLVSITHAATDYDIGDRVGRVAVTVDDDDINSDPSFDTMVGPQNYVSGVTIPTLTLPAATGGNGDLSYALLPADTIPAGLTVALDSRTLTGTPTTSGGVTLTWTALDDDADTGSLTFTLTITGNAPDFVTASVMTQQYFVGVTIPTLTLPAATGGDGALSYALTGGIPGGLAFSSSDLTLTGSPTTLTTVTLTYTVADADADTTAADETFLTFMVVVNQTPPTITIAPTALTVDEGSSMTYTAVLDTAPTGDVILTPGVPDGSAVTVSGALTFTVANWNAAQTVMVMAGDDADADDATVTVSHAVSVYGGATTAGAVIVTVMDTDIRISPSFGGATVEPQSYLSGVTIPTLTLPAATGGDGALSYALTGGIPDGLAFSSSDLTLTGTPTALTTVTLTWTATDADADTTADDEAVLTFMVVVNQTPPTITIAPTALTVNEGSSTTYTVVLDTAPTGDVILTPGVSDGSAATVSGALTFTVANWNAAQAVTVTAVDDADTDDATVTVSHAVSVYGGATTAGAVIVTVMDTDIPTSPSFGTATVEPQSYLSGEAIPTLTLPPATGGAGDLTYALTPTSAIPAGLTVDLDARTLAGTPTVAGSATLDWTASALGDTGTLTFTLTIVDNVRPDFGTEMVMPQQYFVGAGIPTLALPAATGGNGALSYTLTGGIPGGLIFSSGARTLTGAPTTAAAAVTLTYTATDTDVDTTAADEAVLTFTVTVGSEMPPTVTIAPTALMMNEGSSMTYAAVLDTAPTDTVILTPSVPAGSAVTVPGALTFSVANWNAAQTVTVTAVDDADGDNATVIISHVVGVYGGTTGAAAVTVRVRDTDPGAIPSFGAVMVGPQTYTAREAIPTLTLPVASGGNGDLSYTLTPASEIPTGLAFDLGERTLTGTPTVAGLATLTWTALDEDADSGSLTFTLTITPNVPPDFGTGMVESQRYFVGAAIPTLTLPPATGGNGALNYALTGGIPDGLLFSSGARTLTGTPSAAVAGVMLTYTVTDTDTDTTADDDDVLMFMVTVGSEMPPTITIAPTALTVDEGSSMIYTAVLATAPTGDVILRPGVPDGSVVTVSGALTFTVANWNTAQTVSVMAVEDADTADDVVTVSHAVSVYGGSTIADAVRVTVDDNDLPPGFITSGLIPPGNPQLNINEGGMVTYTVRLATDPGPGTVRVSSVILRTGDTEDFGIAFFPDDGRRGRLEFDSTNWNTAQTVTLFAMEDENNVNETYFIQTTVTGYGSITLGPFASVTVIDNDVPRVNISSSTLTVDEGETAIYTAVLNIAPTGAVTVTPSVTGSMVTVSDALTFSATAWNTAQTVTVTTGQDADDTDATAIVTHAVSGYGDVTTANDVTVTVTDTVSIPDFGDARVSNQLYTADTAIPTLTLPAATSGDGTLSYALTGGIPAGLTFSSGARTLTGTPTDLTVATLTYTVTDTDADTTDDDEDSRTFVVTVSGGDPAVDISLSTLALNEGNSATYRVRLATLPAGSVTIGPGIPDGSEVTITGALTFSVTTWSVYQTVTVTASNDADDDDATVTITHAVSGYGGVTADGVTVTVTDTNSIPTFRAMVPSPLYTVDTTIATLTLPDADGGDGTLSYALTGGIPAGLTFSAGARTLTGTPTAITTVTLTYTVTDTDADNTAADDDVQTFIITVGAGDPAVAISPPTLALDEGGSAPYMVRLVAPPTGNVTITPSIPDGSAITITGALTFSVTTWSVFQTVIVTAAMDPDDDDATVTIAHGVGGYGGVTADAVTVTVADTNSAPIFLATIRSQIYTVGAAIPTLTLPTATGGDSEGGIVNYALTGAIPDGLRHTGARTLTGTPTTAAAAVTLTYVASDVDLNNAAEDDATLIFTITVEPPAPAVTISPMALTVDEGSSITYTVALATEPAGDVVVTPSVSDGSVVMVAGVLTFTSTDWNIRQSVTVDAIMDRDGDTDTVTITHAVSGYGDVTADAVTVTATDTNSAPEFGTTVGDQRYTVDTGITALTLPTASGDSALIHRLTPIADVPAGLTFDMDAFVLSGTPTVATTVRLTWRATDEQNDVTPMTFTVAVVNVDQTTALNRAILPEVARALADHRVSMIARRIRQAGTDSLEAGRNLTLGGQSTLAGALTTHGRALAEGTFNLRTMLAGSDFVLPLNAREVAPGAGLSALTIWGGGDFRAFSGKGDAIDWSGDMFSAHLGADARLRDDLLAGVALSWSEVDLGYNHTGFGKGDYDVDITSVHPYVGWTAMGGKLDLWATAGYGWGELEITRDSNETQVSDVTMQTIGAGGSAQVLEGRAGTLRLKGEALQTNMDVDGGDGIAAMTVEARRLRLGLEASHTHQLADGHQLVPTLEVGMRHDGGDGRTGTGAEIGGGMRYTNGANGLTVESHGRVLVGHSGDYEDWGISGAVRLVPGSGGQGLSFSLQPTWGATASRASQVWAQEAAATVKTASTPTPRNGQMDMNLGYGLGWDEMLVTPYSQVTLTNGPARSYRLGSRMQLGGGMTFNLEGIREETAARLVNHGIRLHFGVGDRTTVSLEGSRQQTANQTFTNGIKVQVGLSF